MTFHRLGWLFVLVPLASVHAADEPEWLTKARAIEAEPAPMVDIRSPDGGLTARVPAKLAGPITRDEDEYLMQFDVGPDAVVTCELVFDGFDTAGILRVAADVTFEDVGKSLGKVEASTVEALDAGAWGQYPYLAADWIYRVASPEGAQVGGVKQVSVDLHQHGLYCAVVSIGYQQTLRSIARSLAETLKFDGAAPPPKYREITTISIDKTKIGVAVSEVTVDADGDLRTEIRSSSLLPVGAGVVVAQESMLIEWTDPKGSLLNAAQVNVRNGESVVELKLNPEQDGAWHIVGTSRGKAFDNVVGSAAPTSSYALAVKRRDAMAGKQPVGYEATDQVWTTFDPSRLLESRIRITERTPDGSYRAQEKIGDYTVDGVLDPSTGWPSTASTPLGPKTLTATRIYTSGAL